MGYRLAKTAPSEVPTPHDIIWAAGFFEGDGSCKPYRNGSTYLTITQKDTWVLEKLRRLFGGSIGPHHIDKARPELNNSHWQLCGARARGFLMSVYELMSPRRQAQIQKALG